MDHVDADSGVVPYLLATMQARATSCGVLHRGEQAPPLTVSLHGNSISTASLEYLASQLPPSSTDRIVCDMRVVQNGEMRTQCLSEYFANYAHQGGKGDLNMDCVGVDHEGAAQITAHLGNDRSPVEALSLGSNSLQDEGTAMLAEALRNNSTLRALALDSNNIGCRGFSALTDALVHSNTSLQWLELGGNPIFGDRNSSSFTETLDQLGRLLARSVGLKYLGLSHTGLCDGGCGVVAAALAENTGSITFLDLDDNQVSDKGSTSLADGLERNTTMHYLSLSNNQVGRLGAAAISRCAQIRERKGSRLHRVWMAGNKVEGSHLTGCMVETTFRYTNCSLAMSTYLYKR